MVTPSPTPVRWLVAFMDVEPNSGSIRWLLSWLRPGFQHCAAFRGVGEGLLIVQTMLSRVQVDWFPGVSEEQYREELESKGAFVVEVAGLVDDTAWNPRMMTCVSLVRALVGWPARWQTPAGLAAEIARRKG